MVEEVTKDPKTEVGTHLWGAHEVADYIGWPRNQVSAYFHKRKAGIPEPIARLKCGPIWWREDIEAWARDRGYKEG